MFRRVHIIGGPGSGKSYAARILANRLGIPAYDLDDLFWDHAASGYGVPAPVVERHARLQAITSADAWIIEGVYYRWLKPSFERADAIYVLSPNVCLRDWRILNRFVRRKLGIVPGKRENLPDLFKLLQWNHEYDSDNLKRAMDFMREFRDKIEVCRSTDELLRSVLDIAPDIRTPAADSRIF